MKAKKIVLLFDAIIILILTMAMIRVTRTTQIGLNANEKILADNSDMSFNLIASPEETKVKAGATVEITLSAEDIKIGKEGLNSIVGHLSYDESLFDSVEIKAEEKKGWNIELNQIKDHSMYGKFCIYTMQEGVTENQNVVKIKMKLKDDLKPQTTKVYFTELASSDGEVEVLEQDRVVTIIIYEDEIPVEPEPVEPSKPVQTGDNKILVIIVVAILTIILNILTFSKNKKSKVLSIILVVMLGLSSLGIATYAANGDIDIEEALNKLSYRQSWLNSDKYLVTAENVSRVAPGTKADTIKNIFNKQIIITKNGEEVKEGTILGTGMKISVKNPTKIDAEGNYAYELSVYGDTNGDGKSNQVELTKIIRNVVDEEKWNLTGVKKISADLTVDNKIDEKDVNPSVKYIVYGEMSIPEFEPVVEPTIEVVEGTYDKEENCYTTNVKVKITEKAENGIKTQYKVENSKGETVPYTEISREQTESGKYETIIELEKNEIYKVSAYTTGELGNRSGIPYIIVNGVFNNLREYRVEYFYKNLENDKKDIYVEDLSKRVIQYEEIGKLIDTYEDKNKPGYELATEKGINGVEGLPLTISKNEEDNVIKVYYKIHHYSITYNPNGGEWPVEGNPNPTEYTIETPTIEVIDPVRIGYTPIGWTEEEGDVPVKPYKIKIGNTGDIEITAQWEEVLPDPHTVTAEIVGGHGTIEPITQVVEHGESVSNIVITPEENYVVAKARIYSGTKDETRTYDPVNDTDGTLLRVATRPDITGKIKVETITNVTEDKHVVVKLKEKSTDIVAKIVVVPSDNETLSNLESDVDGEPILNHEYETLEDALSDALKVNNKRDVLGLTGEVKILILKDIEDETSTVKTTNDSTTQNEVVINLDGHTIAANTDTATITVNSGASLQIIDESSEDDGKILNTLGPAIKINEGSELTLGTNDQKISYTAPVIEGKENGIIKDAGDNEGVFNFYDGKIIGDNSALSGSSIVDDTPNGYKYSQEEIGGRQVATLQINNNIEAMIGQTTFVTLEDAFDRVNNNEEWGNNDEIEIDVVAPMVDIDTSAIVLNANKNVKLDLNGNTIKSSNATIEIIQNNGTLTIVDSTKYEEGVNYKEVKQSESGEYGFVKEKNYYKSNNNGISSSIADSYIELDLRNVDEASENQVAINANVISEANNDYGYAIITESKEVPTDLTDAIFKISGIEIAKDYSKTLNGGKMYYLHIGYVKNESEDYLLDQLVVNDITLNNQELLEDASFGTGKIDGKIVNQKDAKFVLESGKLIDKINGVYNYGYIEISGGISYARINNQVAEAEVDVKGGILSNEIAINNLNEGYIKVSDAARIYGGSYRSSDGEPLNGTIYCGTGELNVTDGLIVCTGGTLIDATNANNISITGGTFVAKSTGISTKHIENNNVLIEGTENNRIKIFVGNSGITYNTYTANKELTLKNINIESKGTGISGAGNLNLDNINIDAELSSISVGNGEVNILSGNYNCTSDYNPCISFSGTLNIGKKNDTNNTEISVTNPRIYGKNSAIRANTGEAKVYFYDGILITKTDVLNNYSINGIEEYDSDGNPMKISIEEYTEESGMNQMTLKSATEKVARINKTYATKINLINPKPSEDDTYYYFNTLDLAINSCNTNNNNVEIEIIKDEVTMADTTIEEGKNITLNLNGNKITLQGQMKINENATLELTNNSEEGEFIVANNLVRVDSYNYGKFIVKNAIFNNNRNTSNGYIVNMGEMDVDNGKVEFVHNNAKLNIYNDGQVGCQQNKIEGIDDCITHITSGTLKADTMNGILNINSGDSTEKTNVTLYTTATGIGGKVNINNVNLNTSLESNVNIKFTGELLIENSVIKGNMTASGENERIIRNSTIYGNLHMEDSNYPLGGKIEITGSTIGTQENNAEVSIVNKNADNNPINISNTTIYGYLASKNANNAEVHLLNGTKVICNNGAALRGGAMSNGAADGKIIIGSENEIFSTESPYIEGVDTTIINSAVSFYSGKIVTHHRETENYNGSISETEKTAKIEEIKQNADNNTNYIQNGMNFVAVRDGLMPVSTIVYNNVTDDTEANKIDVEVTKTTILGKTAVAKILKENCDVTGLSEDDYAENGEFYQFYELQKAVNSCKDNVQAEVILLENIVINDEAKVLNITNNQKINLNLSGKQITVSVKDAIINSGELSITDTSTDNAGTIYFNGDKLIENTGKLNIEGGNITDNATNGVYMLNQITNKNELTINTPGTIIANIYNYAGNSKLKIMNCKTKTQPATLDYCIVTNLSTSDEAVEITGGEISAVYSFAGNTTISGGTIRKIYNGYSTYEKVGSGDAQYSKISINSGLIPTSGSNKKETIVPIYSKSQVVYLTNNLYISDGSIDNLGDTPPVAKMTITGNANIQSSVSNNGTMSINIAGTTSATIINKDKSTLNVNGGTYNGTIINAEYESDYGYKNAQSTGTLTIKDATINGKIENNGNLVLGDNNNNISNSLKINKTISNYASGKMYYYDGVLAATDTITEPIDGGIAEIATDAIIKSEKVNNKTQYTLISLTNGIYKVDVNGTTSYKNTLQEAIDMCTTNSSTTPDKITLIQDIVAVENEKGVISENQNIIFDLNGNTITGKTMGTMFENGGMLEIKDSSGDGQIVGLFNKIIDNKGTLVLSGGNIKLDPPTETIDAHYIIDNSGELTIAGANIELIKKADRNGTNGAINSVAGTAVNFNSGNIIFNNAKQLLAVPNVVKISGTSELKTEVTIKDEFKFSGSGTCIECTQTQITVEGDSFENTNTTALIPIIISDSDMIIKEGAVIDGDHINPIQYYGTCKVDINSNAKLSGLVEYINTRNPNAVAAKDVELTINEAELGKIEFYGSKATINNATVSDKATFSNKLTIAGIANTTSDITITGGTFGSLVINYNAIAKVNEVNVTTGGMSVESGADVTLLNSTIINQNGVGLTVSQKQTSAAKPTITIGTNEIDMMPDIDIVSPHIEGSTYGMAVNNATVNWYDGVLVGGTMAFSVGNGGTINYPSYNEVSYTAVYEDSASKRAHVGVIATVNDIIQIGSTNYTTFSGAIEHIDTLNNKTATIEMLKTVELAEPVTIPSGYNVTIDLKGHAITSTDVVFIVGTGATLTIIDDTGMGQISSGTKETIKNNGTLIIGNNGDGNVSNNSPLIKGRTYAIVNSGTLNMYDGILKSIETDVISGNQISGKPTEYSVKTSTQVINEITYTTMYLGQ